MKVKNFKFGLKLWSTNLDQIPYAKKLYRENKFDYLELTYVPGSFDKMEPWLELRCPFVIHAPQYDLGMNLADQSRRAQNRQLLSETIQFADKLNSAHIILHPGENGSLVETVYQVRKLSGKSFLFENLPLQELIAGVRGLGSTVTEIQYLLNNLPNTGFCLDFTHAFCSAVSHKLDPYELIANFIKLNPAMYHLTDADINSPIDQHLNIGQGNIDFRRIFSLLPEGAWITIESNKNFKNNLLDFAQDVETLISYIKDYN